MSWLARAGACVLVILVGIAALSPWLAGASGIDLNRASLAPAWNGPLLGTDMQGRDSLYLILHGIRLSFAAAALAVLVTLAAGVPIGLFAGYAGGWMDTVLMRLADAQMSFPLILMAIAIDGVAAVRLSMTGHDSWMLPLVSVSIGLSQWAVTARTVRAVVLSERGRAYVDAARVYGASHAAILFRHILPNTLGPITVLAAMQFSTAVLAESTLSFLGAGLPAATPSLGTLVRTGHEQLLAGSWWLVLFPGSALLLLSLAANLTGDWIRERLDPKDSVR